MDLFVFRWSWRWIKGGANDAHNAAERTIEECKYAASIRRCRHPKLSRATALILPLLPRIPFLLLLSSPSLPPPPSSSSARASYFERGIRGRNRKRHGRASNRYSIAVSPRTGPSLSAGSTISNSIENSFFLPFLWKYFFRTKSEEFFFLSDSEVKKRK